MACEQVLDSTGVGGSFLPSPVPKLQELNICNRILQSPDKLVIKL